MGTFINSEDQDEMPHNAVFHQGIHFLFEVKKGLQAKKSFYLKCITWHP